MPKTNVVLTDVAQGAWLDKYELRESSDVRLAGSNRWSISKRTLRGGLSDGVDVIDLNNGALSLSILPTRGMGLWRGQLGDIPLGWDSPVKLPVNPAFVNQTDRNGLGWLSGFNELMCRCGLNSHGAPGLDVIVDNTGKRTEAPLTLHGKIANTPAHRVEISVDPSGQGMLSVTGVVDETMLFGPCLRLTSTYETIAGSSSVTIRDEVMNLSGRPAEFELLYHTNIGPPFLDAGAQLVVPFREVAPRDAHAASDIKTWPTYLAPTAGYVEQCYFADLIPDEHGNTLTLLRNKAGNRGISLEYGVRELPCFTVWKCTQAEADGYVTGLEPATSLPNHKSFERSQGRVITLAPGQSHRATIKLTVHGTAADVSATEKRIAAIQDRAHPVTHPQPIGKYAPLS